MNGLFRFAKRSPLEESIIKLSNSLFNSFFSERSLYGWACEAAHPDFNGRMRVSTAHEDVLVKISCSNFTTFGEYDTPKTVEFAICDLAESWEMVVRYDTTEPLEEEFVFVDGLRAESLPHAYVGGTGDGHAARRWLMLWKLNHSADAED